MAQNCPGQIERPCDEFDQKLNRAQGQVRDFDKELRKLENKLANIEQRLATRTQALSAKDFKQLLLRLQILISSVRI